MNRAASFIPSHAQSQVGPRGQLALAKLRLIELGAPYTSERPTIAKFVRRHPLEFAAGAAIAGVLLSRFRIGRSALKLLTLRTSGELLRRVLGGLL